MIQGQRIKLNLLEDSFFINNNISEVNIMENNNYYFEYKMPEALAKELLRARDSADKKLRPAEYLVKYVNEQFNLLKPVKRVILY